MLLTQEWAVAETRARHFKAARDIFARALALNPRHVPALAACAYCEGLAGQTNAARNLYARALQVSHRTDHHDGGPPPSMLARKKIASLNCAWKQLLLRMSSLERP